MTPIGKNIIVVDERGNEYEATYPKRAKGLVKNGRARFIDEHTICLACPPDKSEDIHMSENTSTEQTTNISNIEAPAAETSAPLTEREIFEKIASLQMHLTESSYNSLLRLDDSISSICDCDGESEEKYDQISELCRVFTMRETTYLKMIELYERMYSDLNSLNKIDTIKAAFSDQLEFINNSHLEIQDKFAAISGITDKIADLTEKLLIPATPESVKQTIANELTWAISSSSSSNDAKAFASDVLQACMAHN